MYNKRTFYVLMLNIILIVIVTIISFKIGQRNGAFRERIQRIPIDIVTYVRVYKMNEYIHNASEVKPPPFNVRVWLFGSLNMFDTYHEKYYCNDISPYFSSYFEEARGIVTNLTIVNLEESVLDALKKENIGVMPKAQIKAANE